MKACLLCALLVFSTCSLGTEVLLLGGGGEPQGEKTIFDNSIKKLALKKTSLDFNLKASFNGGHSETEAILKNELKTENTPFVEANYLAAIDEYAEKIKTGKIKKGEKLLIIVDTHGGQGSSKHKTHSISMSGSKVSNFSSIEGPGSDSLDKLSVLSELAKKRGIHLGIIDMSCHSGNSLPLANENTCVITSSGPDHFGYSSFGESFYSQMEKGKSLEEVFLKTRAKFDLPSFPMISTDIGLEINQEQYDLFSPYLYTTTNSAIDKLTPYLRSVFTDDNLCKRENDFSSLIKQLEDFQAVVGGLKSKYGPNDLLEVLQSYKEDQDEYIQTLIKMGFPLFDMKEKILYPSSETGKDGKPKMLSVELEWRDILMAFSLSSRDYFRERLREKKSMAERTDLLNSISKFEKIDEVRQRILKQYPDLKKTEDYLKSLEKHSGQMWDKATKISELANKFYEHRYREKMKAQPKKPNPCSDFVL